MHPTVGPRLCCFDHAARGGIWFSLVLHELVTEFPLDRLRASMQPIVGPHLCCFHSAAWGGIWFLWCFMSSSQRFRGRFVLPWHLAQGQGCCDDVRSVGADADEVPRAQRGVLCHVGIGDVQVKARAICATPACGRTLSAGMNLLCRACELCNRRTEGSRVKS